MDFRGIFEHGVVRPTEPVALPQGTEVECHPVGAHHRAAHGDQFWRRRSIEQLAQEQGVMPSNAAADLRGDWPPGEPINDFLDDVRKGRR